MQVHEKFGYDSSYEDVPTHYHVVIAIPRGSKAVLVQRQENGEFSLPTASFDPEQVSVTTKARNVLTNFGLTIQAKDLRELAGDLWQPKFEGGRLVSVDVFFGLFVEGVNHMRVLNPRSDLLEMTVEGVKSLPLVGSTRSDSPESKEFDARAQLLFDALSVTAGPFFEEPETWKRIEEIGHKLSEDGFFPIFNGAYLGNYRNSSYRYYYRLDPRQPDGRYSGPLDQLVGS
jgi:hypothetical protein